MAEIDCTPSVHMTRAEWRNKVRAGAKWAFTCEGCGCAAYRKQSGTNTARGIVNRFCSMACRVGNAAKVRSEVDAIRRIGMLSRNEKLYISRKRKALIRSVAILLDKIRRVKIRASNPCAVCGSPCGGGKTLTRTYCSDECQKSTQAYRELKRKYRSKRRAIERGCKEARAIDPIKVFDRDGWRCQICLKPTPQKLRGTYNDRAPELDHIVPITKGGSHTWTNLQCACRKCNGIKGNKSNAGQMGLFTALMQ